jgi:hypothetical protein
MHILPAFFTTTNTKKRKPSASKRLAKSREEHEIWILSMTKGKRADKKTLDKLNKVKYDSVKYETLNKTGVASGACAKKAEMFYSGERKLLGIATMHKSNMVPVFAKQDAEDIAKMRRG